MPLGTERQRSGEHRITHCPSAAHHATFDGESTCFSLIGSEIHETHLTIENAMPREGRGLPVGIHVTTTYSKRRRTKSLVRATHQNQVILSHRFAIAAEHGCEYDAASHYSASRSGRERRHSDYDPRAFREDQSGGDAPLPFTTVAQFVERLKADSTWTDREIIEMQMRVISVLLNERGRR